MLDIQSCCAGSSASDHSHLSDVDPALDDVSGHRLRAGEQPIESDDAQPSPHFILKSKNPLLSLRAALFEAYDHQTVRRLELWKCGGSLSEALHQECLVLEGLRDGVSRVSAELIVGCRESFAWCLDFNDEIATVDPSQYEIGFG